MEFETIGGYDIWYKTTEINKEKSTSVEFIFTNIFPDKAPFLNKYHGGFAVMTNKFGTVYAPPEIANLVDGPVCLHIGEKQFAVNCEPSLKVKYLCGIGINNEIYETIDSHEYKLEFKGFGIEGKLNAKKATLCPSPLLDINPNSISKIFSDRLNNLRSS